MGYRQKLNDRKIAIVVLGLQQLPKLRPYVQIVVEAVNNAQPCSYTELGLPFT
jgi:hypothetical protein